MQKRVVIINNRASRAKNHPDLKKLLKEDTWLSDVYVLDNPKQMAKIIKQHADTTQLFIFGGGDGTILGGIQTAIESGYAQEFAIIPLGTSNYLARNLGLDLDPRAAIKQLKQGKARPVYLGKANKNLFALMAVVGLAAEVSEQVEVKTKQRHGQLAYIYQAIKSLAHDTSFDYKLTIDTDTIIQGKSMQIICNNVDLNQQLTILPASDITQKSMKIIVFETQKSKLKLIGSIVAYAVSLGKIKLWMRVFTTRTAKLETIPQLDVSLDGEVLEKTPININIEQEPINIRIATD